MPRRAVLIGLERVIDLGFTPNDECLLLARPRQSTGAVMKSARRRRLPRAIPNACSFERTSACCRSAPQTCRSVFGHERPFVVSASIGSLRPPWTFRPGDRMAGAGRIRNGSYGVSNRDKQTLVRGSCRRQIVTHARTRLAGGASKPSLIASCARVRHKRPL
jgi:hypothetical protein